MLVNSSLSLQQYFFEVDGFEVLPLEKANADSVAHFHQRNRARIEPVSPARSEYYYTTAYWKQAIRVARKERKSGAALRWVCVEDSATVSQFSLDNIVYGVFRSAFLSYAVDRQLEGRGIMFKCLQQAIDIAFKDLDLHRIEAHHLPDNERSAAVLKRLNFEKEGYAKSLLKLNGIWKDHVLNALINPEHL